MDDQGSNLGSHNVNWQMSFASILQFCNTYMSKTGVSAKRSTYETHDEDPSYDGGANIARTEGQEG